MTARNAVNIDRLDPSVADDEPNGYGQSSEDSYVRLVHRGAGQAGSTHGSLEEAFREHRGKLLRYLQARGASNDAEDLLQEMWIKLTEHDTRPVTDQLRYMYRIIHNLMIDRYRSNARRKRRELYYEELAPAADHAAERPGVERILIAREGLRMVEALLAALGPKTDMIFRRYRVDGIPQRLIAAELGLSVSAVEKHLQKAYRALLASTDPVVPDNDRPAPADGKGCTHGRP